MKGKKAHKKVKKQVLKSERMWNKKYAKGGITPKKARKMLKDGTAQGKSLTDKQKRYFGAIAGGKEDNVRKRARMERGGKVNVDTFMPILPLSGKNLIVNDITFLENELTKTTDVFTSNCYRNFIKKEEKRNRKNREEIVKKNKLTHKSS